MNRPTRIIAAEQDGRARFTSAEFMRMAEAGAFEDMKVELVRGELERRNPPKSDHGARQMDIGFALRQAIDWSSGLRVLGETGIDLGNDTVRGCDLTLIRIVPAESRFLRPEDVLLVIEIADSTLNRDLGDKRIDYAGAGIPHYWVVDAERSVVHVFEQPVSGEYAEVRTVRFGEPLAVPGVDRTIRID